MNSFSFTSYKFETLIQKIYLNVSAHSEKSMRKLLIKKVKKYTIYRC